MVVLCWIASQVGRGCLFISLIKASCLTHMSHVPTSLSYKPHFISIPQQTNSYSSQWSSAISVSSVSSHQHPAPSPILISITSTTTRPGTSYP